MNPEQTEQSEPEAGRLRPLGSPVRDADLRHLSLRMGVLYERVLKPLREDSVGTNEWGGFDVRSRSGLKIRVAHDDALSEGAIYLHAFPLDAYACLWSAQFDAQVDLDVIEAALRAAVAS